MEHPRTVAQLCEEHHIDLKGLASQCGLDEARVQAIIEGRWTPSPAERDRIAAVFGLTRADIAWSHATPVSHLYGHGPQFGRTP
jgi:hypothetical protein